MPWRVSHSGPVFRHETPRPGRLREFEQVHVLDITNAARLVTYAMVGGPGEICLNGVAAHLVAVGDLVIIVAYADVDEAELERFTPRIVHVDASNRVHAPVPTG